MGGLRTLLTKSPAGVALGVLLVFVVAYLVVGQFRGRAHESAQVQPRTGPATRTQPLPPAARTTGPGAATAPAAAPKPAPQATPSPASAVPGKPASAGVPSGPTGRADPFIPLVRPGGTSAQAPPPPAPPSPLVTLPPPPLPGGALPPPPLPGGGVQIPAPGAGLAVTGIVGDHGAVAVVIVDGRSEILSVGESIGDLRVIKIDAARRIVRFSRAGRQFDVRMGGE